MIPDETFFDYDMLHERRKGRVRRLLMLVTVMMCGAMGATLVVQNAKPNGFDHSAVLPQSSDPGQK